MTSVERASLSFFQSHTAKVWSGWTDDYFWSNLALQVAQTSQTVARSLVAMSAFHEHTMALTNDDRECLRGYSRQQSSRATAALWQRTTVSYFEALVSNLIMICYHGLQSTPAHLMLLRSAMKMLAECEHATNVTRNERDSIDCHLRPLYRRIISRLCNMVDMCKALEQSLLKHAKTHDLVDDCERPLIPEVFGSTVDARNCLDAILNWTHDALARCALNEVAISSILAEFCRLKMRWQASLDKLPLRGDAHRSRAKLLLEASSLVGKVLVHSILATNEVWFDDFHEDFERVVILLEKTWSSNHNFGIDAGSIDMAAFVGTKCRHPDLRRRALRLLKSSERSEGSRKAANPAAILEALIRLEERGLGGAATKSEDIVERNRRRLISGQQYHTIGRINLCFASADGAHMDRHSVSLLPARPRDDPCQDSQEPSMLTITPEARFGVGYAHFLQDRSMGTYFCLESDRFYFPIPKVTS